MAKPYYNLMTGKLGVMVGVCIPGWQENGEKCDLFQMLKIWHLPVIKAMSGQIA